MFPNFYKDNKSKIIFLYTQVLDEIFKRKHTLKIQKEIDVYRSRQEQIEIIEKRTLLRKATRKHKKKHSQRIYDANSDIRSYKCYKAKKEFESAFNDEIKKVEEESEAPKKFKRDGSDDTEDEEELIILKHKPDPLIVINTPIQHNLAPVEIQPVVKYRRILYDDK
jgi:hypothetical protein